MKCTTCVDMLSISERKFKVDSVLKKLVNIDIHLYKILGVYSENLVVTLTLSLHQAHFLNIIIIILHKTILHPQTKLSCTILIPSLLYLQEQDQDRPQPLLLQCPVLTALLRMVRNM